MSKNNNDWIRSGLERRGYRQKDVAKAWESQPASVSRFFSGDELQDLPLSKAAALASMLGITIDELAKGLGHKGPVVEPSVASLAPTPLGTLNMSQPSPGVTRIEIRRDVTHKTAQGIVSLLMADTLPDKPVIP